MENIPVKQSKRRQASIDRETNETNIRVELNLDGSGKADVNTGIPFFDHMLTLFSVHGFFDLLIRARGDLDVDFHHTVEDVGLVLGSVFDKALGDRKRINRFGHAVTPMDDALAEVTVDLSNRPFLVYHIPDAMNAGTVFDPALAKEFFRSLSVKGGLNLHINVKYGENDHHVMEAVFKALGRSLDHAVSFDKRLADVRSSKGIL